MVTRFLDTNIVLYAVSAAPEEARKRGIARVVLAERDNAISVQVLQEFYVQSTRPSRPGALTHREAVRFMETLRRFPVAPVTVDVLDAALDLRSRFSLSYWDSAILAAARIMDCDHVYSEDMSSTQDYNGIRVINPFT